MSGISWTDQTWNPIVGCSKVSAGCDHCWAERMARLHYSELFPGGWFGTVMPFPGRLEQPLHWRKPRRIAVGLMGDLFHENVADEFIDEVFAVMACCRRHTFQLLTKRPERMHAYFSNDRPSRIDYAVGQLMAQNYGYMIGSFKCLLQPNVAGGIEGWPLPNVWLGVSCENQAAADERIPLLLQTPAAARFVSLEPLLESIYIRWALHKYPEIHPFKIKKGLDWVIAGGESGPGARPMHPDWVRSLRDQCEELRMPFHFKQCGEWAWWAGADTIKKNQKTIRLTIKGNDGSNLANSGDGGDIWMYRCGKKASGRLLDGREWLEFPNA